jgi:hypothetical protein
MTVVAAGDRVFEHKVRNFPEEAYSFERGTHLRALMWSLLGDPGLGQLRKWQEIARAAGHIGFAEFGDLDYFWGTFLGLARLPAEQYPWDPYVDPLTHEQDDEVRIKDGLYRARLRLLLMALARGATNEGMAMACEAACGVPCQVLEVWRALDGTGPDTSQPSTTWAAETEYPYGARVIPSPPNAHLYRAVQAGFSGTAQPAFPTGAGATVADGTVVWQEVPVTWGRLNAPKEFVVIPKTDSLTPQQERALLEVAHRLKPANTVPTIDPGSIETHTVLAVVHAAADSEYWEATRWAIQWGERAVPPPHGVRRNPTWGVFAPPGVEQQVPTPAHARPGEYVSLRGAVVSVTAHRQLSPAPTLAWRPNKAYAEDDHVYGTSARAVFRAEEAGTSGAVEPAWPAAGYGSPPTILDGTITWRRASQPSGWRRDRPPSFGSWQEVGLSDSPDNFPEGRYPSDPTRRDAAGAYVYDWESQAQYESWLARFVEALGGEIAGLLYRLPTARSYSDDDWEDRAISTEAILASGVGEVTSGYYRGRGD